MRSHAKASSAGSTEGSGKDRGLFRRAFASRGASSEVRGDGALSFGRFVLLTAVLANVALAAAAPGAVAALTPGYGPLGSFKLPVDPGELAVDDSTGNVVVASLDAHVLVFPPDLSSGGTASPLTEFATPGPAKSIAIDQSNGAIYISNNTNVNEAQAVVLAHAGGGSFTLSFEGQTTTPIAFDANAITVRSALEALSSIGAGNVEVNGSGPYTITFTGALADTDVPQLSADASALAQAAPAINVNVAAPGVRNVSLANAGSGSFTLSFEGQTTTPIAFDANATTVQSALEALSSIGAGNVEVNGSGPYTITFTGPLSETEIPLSADATGLSVNPSASVNIAAPGVRSLKLAHASGGSFTLSFEGQTTTPIAFDANATTVQSALEALSSIGAGNVEVSGFGPYTITFTGALAETEAPLNADGTELLANPTVRVGTVQIGSRKGILRYLSSGAPVPSYTVDTTFISPVLGNYIAPLAVDPVTHDLLVGDVDHVNRYSSAGVLLGSFDGSDSLDGKFTSIADIAVGATKTYVLNLEGDPSHASGVSRVDQFSDQGTYERTLHAIDTPVAVAVDANDRPLVVARTEPLLGGAQLFTIDDGEVGTAGNILPSPAVYIGGLAVDGGASGRVYVSVAGSPYIGTPESGIGILVPGPGVRLDAPTSPDPESLHLSATVNPEGKETTAYFEYCWERDPCATDNSVAWQQVPGIAVGSGSADVESVEADLSNLHPQSKYSVRIAATDTQTTVYSTPVAAMTAGVPPAATTGTATEISTTSVVLHGKVNPLGQTSAFYFEYGETTAYGSRTLAGSGDLVGVADYNPASVLREIKGLKAGTIYHYRLAGVNDTGIGYGEDATFTTDPGDTPPRAYEMVSPVEKHGVAISHYPFGIEARDDGNAIIYGTEKGVYPDAKSAPFVPRVLGTRSGGAWSNISLDPLITTHVDISDDLIFATLAVSKDFSRVLVVSTNKLTKDAVADVANLYIYEPATNHYTLIANNDWGLEGLEIIATRNLVGTSADLSTVVFYGLATGSEPGGIYKWTEGEGLRLVSREPDDTPLEPGPSYSNLSRCGVSADGSRIYFGTTFAASIGVGLYLRENGEKTVLVASSGLCRGLSADGRYVIYTVGSDAYRYDAETNTSTLLASGINTNEILAVRPAAGEMYYGNGSEVLHLHDGTVTQVLPSTGIDSVQASPSGRYLGFLSDSQRTSFDNAGKVEAYLYDAQTETLSCASCRSDGGVPVGGTSMRLGGTHFFPRAVLDDGTLLFDTLEPLVIRDVNATQDVYSYTDGRVSLISPGTRRINSHFATATPDGDNVYFTTDAQLVGQDQDDVIDLYDARRRGGLAAQNQPPAIACLRDDCKATPNAGPELPFGGSEGLNGPENLSAPVRKRCAKGSRVKARGKTHCAKAQRKQTKRAKNNRRNAR